MYLKLLVIVLALPFLFKGNDAKISTNTVEKQDLDDKIEKIQEDSKNKALLEAYTKRALGSSHKNKQSFGDVSLELARMNILERIVKRRKAVTSLQNEVNELSGDKCNKIKKVGEPIVHHHSGYIYGAWMRDPLGLLGREKIWYINGYHTNKVLEFESMNHFKAGQICKTYTLPYTIDGTGSVVYGRYLYFNRASSNYVVQYDLVTEKVIKQTCPNGNIKPRKYYYPWSSVNTMDLSVDESGLWVLYSYSSYKGKLCATQLDPLTLRTLNNYYGISSESMKSMGNAFVACGIVYSIDHYSGTTTINYAYDTATGSRTNPGIKFINRFGLISMVTYNPREKVLYAWDKNRQITYPLEFED